MYYYEEVVYLVLYKKETRPNEIMSVFELRLVKSLVFTDLNVKLSQLTMTVLKSKNTI